MDLGLAGKSAVVTGAGRGIGLAITRALVAEGASVVAGSRTITPELKELADGGRVQPVALDLSAAAGPDELIAAAGDRLDILVNNVGGAPVRTGGFAAITDGEWLASLELNLLAAVRACRAAVPQMIAAGRGAIVMTSSVNSTLADPQVIDYSAAKAAVANLAKSLARELGPHGVRVNTVSPGPVATDLWLGAGGVAETVAKAHGGSAKDVAAGAAAGAATGRFTRPEEVADAVLFLASDRALNITGADLRIDGGLVPTWN